MDNLRQGRYPAAAEIFRRLLQQDPRDLRGYVGLANSLLADGQGEAALAAGQAGLAVDSTAAPLYNILAAVYSSEGRYAPAVEALEKAVHFHPDYALGYVNLGGMYTKMGSYENAEKYLRRAVALEPERPSIRRRLGELYLNNGHPEEALQELRHAIRLYPDDATLYFLLGKALEADGQNEEAWQAFTKACQFDIGFGEAHYRAAVLGRKLGYNAQADSALKVFGHLQELGQVDPAIPKQLQKLRLAILDSPEEPLYHYQLGLFYAQHGYGDEALNKFDKVLKLQPANFQAVNHIGNILLQQKKPETALEFYERAVQLAPDFLPARMNAAQVYMQLNRPETALKHLRIAAEVAPGVPMVWYNLALCLLALGQPMAADSTLQAGLAAAQPQGEVRRAFEALQAETRSSR